MRLVGFRLLEGGEILINPDHVVAVKSGADGGSVEICLGGSLHRSYDVSADIATVREQLTGKTT